MEEGDKEGKRKRRGMGSKEGWKDARTGKGEGGERGIKRCWGER